MAVQDAMASMARAFKDLQYRWVEVRGSWNDEVSKRFEEKYLAAWERDFRTTVGQVETMSTYLQQVRRDCE